MRARWKDGARSSGLLNGTLGTGESSAKRVFAFYGDQKRRSHRRNNEPRLSLADYKAPLSPWTANFPNTHAGLQPILIFIAALAQRYTVFPIMNSSLPFISKLGLAGQTEIHVMSTKINDDAGVGALYLSLGQAEENAGMSSNIMNELSWCVSCVRH